MASGFTIDGINWDARAFRQNERFATMLHRLYLEVAKEVSSIAQSSINYNPSKPFRLSDYPAANRRINDLLKKLSNDTTAIVQRGTLQAWAIANAKNDALIDFMAKQTGISPSVLRSQYNYGERNEVGLRAFQNRKIDGMGLSERIWQHTKSAKKEIEVAIDIGLQQGKSAASLSKDIRQSLIEPNRLYRRIRNAKGELKLSKAAASYHPGQGVYRSSYKNAMRVTRTEVNMAYREADYQRWKQIDFIKGIEVRLSNNPNHCPTCEALAGKYPKDFHFSGWHPQCRCIAVPLLLDRDEYNAYELAKLNGDKYNIHGEVEQPNAKFNKWLRENEDKIKRAKNVPYFIRDNAQFSGKTTQLLINKTIQDAPLSQGIAKSVALKYGGVFTSNVKSRKRIMEKATLDYGGSISDVRDIARSTIVVPPSSINEALKDLKRAVNVVEVKTQSTPLGYEGILTQILNKTGTYAEVQINTPQMIYAKEVNAKDLLGEVLFNKIKSASGLPPGLGHRYYEEYRQLRKLNKATDRSKIRSIEALSKSYYEKIRAVRL